MPTLSSYLPLALQAYDYAANQESARDITKPMSQAYQQGIDYTRETFDPYVEAGKGALGRYEGLLADPSSITSDPGYEFGVQQGQQALERSAAAGGNLLSGKTLLDVNKYGQEYGQQYYDKALGRQAGLAQMGLSAGSAAAPQVSRLYEAKGEVPATRELLQQMNRRTTMEGLTGLLTGGGAGGRGATLPGAARDLVGGVTGALGDIAGAVGDIFGGEFGDDLGNLVSGSIFDPDFWGGAFEGAGNFFDDIGGAVWDSVGDVVDFFQ
jgi:hypothetical protein